MAFVEAECGLIAGAKAIFILEGELNHKLCLPLVLDVVELYVPV